MKPLKYFNRKKIKNKKKSKVPIEWNIVIKSHGIDLKLKALNKKIHLLILWYHIGKDQLY